MQSNQHVGIPPSEKRARASVGGDAYARGNPDRTSASQQEPVETNPDGIRQRIGYLDNNQLTDVVVKAAQNHPDVNGMINSAVQEIRDRERKGAIDFDWKSKAVWREINIAHDRKSGSAQYDEAWGVTGYVLSTMNGIVQKCGQFASPQTRYNGLSVLRKIGETICLSSNVIAHEVPKHFQGSCRGYENGLLKIVLAMDPNERWAISDESYDEALWPKLLELEELANGFCIFENLWEVLDLLEGADEGGQQHPEEEEEEEEEDEESEED